MAGRGDQAAFLLLNSYSINLNCPIHQRGHNLDNQSLEEKAGAAQVSVQADRCAVLPFIKEADIISVWYDMAVLFQFLPDGPETPTITVSASGQGATVGSFVLVNSTVNLTCLAPSEPPAKIYWNVADAQDPFVPSSPVLLLPRVQLSQAGPYSCLAINLRTQRRVRNTLHLGVAR
ncbi:V-set and immunoglobulin domain-containing protein 10-like [Varanus komodoensis]|nr:V-set and immunoglobulin domain-containing protein 10-like [Varanus komodoensis]